MKLGTVVAPLAILMFGTLGVEAQAGGPFAVSSSPGLEQRAASVAIEPGGRSLVVVWEERRPGERFAQIVGRRFDRLETAGDPPKTLVKAFEAPAQPRVVVAPGGGVILAWKERGGAITAQRFDHELGPQGKRLTVADCCAAGFDLAATNDGFVAVWEKVVPPRVELAPSSGGPPPPPHLLGRRFGGEPLAALEDAKTLAEGLNGDSFGEPVPPHLAYMADAVPVGSTEKGALLVSWQRGGVQGDVFLRAYDSSWRKVPLPLPPGEAERPSINFFRAGLQRRPAVAASSLADLRVVWESGPPRVDIDLALCVNGGQSSREGSDGSGIDTLALALEGFAAALEDRRVTPADGTLRTSVLRFGNGGVETLVGGRPGEPGAPIPDPAAAGQLAASLRLLRPARDEQEGSAARCLCAAAKLLTGEDPCPPADQDLCSLPPLGPAPPAAAGGGRKVVLLATGSLALRPPAVSPFYCDPIAAEVSCQLAGAARLLEWQGVSTVSAARLPDSGSERHLLSLCPDEAPRVDLGSAVFPARPGEEPGFVGEVTSVRGLVGVVGRALLAEEGAESGIFARFLGAGPGAARQIQVNSSVDGDQSAPDIALGPDGASLVVWEDRPRGRIAAQLFAPDGTPVGAEVEVSARLAGARRPRVVAVDRDLFLVAWEESGSATEPTSVQARWLAFPADPGRARK